MGKTILTPKQSEFLELAQSDSQIVKHFYLTGGTALAEFYLHHRLSEDIDLFTEKQEVNQKTIEAFLKKVTLKLHIASIERSQFMGLFSYHLTYADGQKLKVDFNKLILLAKAKFDWHIDKMNLANQFIRIKDIKRKDCPTVLVPFNVWDMETFFLDLAKSLKKDILA